MPINSNVFLLLLLLSCDELKRYRQNTLTYLLFIRCRYSFFSRSFSLRSCSLPVDMTWVLQNSLHCSSLSSWIAVSAETHVVSMLNMLNSAMSPMCMLSRSYWICDNDKRFNHASSISVNAQMWRNSWPAHGEKLILAGLYISHSVDFDRCHKSIHRSSMSISI